MSEIFIQFFAIYRRGFFLWSTLEIARTFAAGGGGGEKPREKFGAAKPHH